MLPFPDYILPVLFVFDGGIFERMSGMRLIDVDEITDGEIVKYLGKEYGSCVPNVRDLLKDQPTAFYVEKVIEKLQVLSDKADDDIAVCKADTCQYYDGYGDGLDRAIEIIKRGGRDEE